MIYQEEIEFDLENFNTNDPEYEGHPNRDTWLISLWINNEQTSQDLYSGMVERATDYHRLKEHTKMFAEEWVGDSYDPDNVCWAHVISNQMAIVQDLKNYKENSNDES